MARVKTNQLRALLFVLAGWLYAAGAAYSQICIDQFIAPDTVSITLPWGTCALTEAQLKDHLGLGQCAPAAVHPAGTYNINQSISISVIDKRYGVVKGSFILRTIPPPVGSLIVVPLAAGECRADRDLLLDQLNAPADPIARSRVHFLQGTARIETFKIGDTTTVSIACGNMVIYPAVKLIFAPQFQAITGSRIYDRGLTACPLSMATVLIDLGYNLTDCNISRFTISHPGPFHYGITRITSIDLDGYRIASNLDIEVYASNCPGISLNYGELHPGQCYLNEHDVIELLGIDLHSCDLSSVRVEPAGPYLDTLTRIEKVFINNYLVCSRGFDLRYQRSSSINEIPAMYCKDQINVSLDAGCDVIINAELILQNRLYCHRNYWIELQNILPGSPKIMGNQLKVSEPGIYNVKVTNPLTGVSCWGAINVEDKFIEDIVCHDDTVSCYNNYDLKPQLSITGAVRFPHIGDNVSFQEIGAGRYAVLTGSKCGISEASYEDQLIASCQQGFKEIIRRRWLFADPSGNNSTCEQLIYVRHLGVDSIMPFDPVSYSCIEDIEILDANANPSPLISGFPVFGNGNNADVCGSLKVSYEDHEWPLCGGGYRITRRWTILDWCSNGVITRDQIITIQDTDVPVWVERPKDMLLSSDPFICGQQHIIIPPPNVRDCDPVLSYEILYETSDYLGNKMTRSNGSSLIIPEISMIGVDNSFNVTYIVKDRCGNASRDSFRIRIIDEEPPVAVCSKYTTISISGNGVAQVRAITFDDLSVDNCGIARYEARKLNGSCHVDLAFTENLRFCCDEVGDTIMVELQVVDHAGNANTCVVQVWVQDRFRPKLTCPADITIDCGESLYDLNITGMADARDNCSIDTLYYVDLDELTQCNFGSIRRQWVTRDRGGFEEICIQNITVAPKTAFAMRKQDFPADITVSTCGESLLPAITGSPVLPLNTCAQINTTYSDLVFENVEFACKKILREWTVIDWCQLSTSVNQSEGIWKSVQVIKVVSDRGPIIPMSFMQPSYCIGAGDCFYNFEINPAIYDGDGCTPPNKIRVRYELFRTVPVRTKVAQGETSRVDLRLAPGQYEMIFIAIDECNNQTTESAVFSVLDCAAPVLACPQALMPFIVPQSGLLEISFDDLNIFAVDNCEDDIFLSFDRSSLVTTLTYDCGILGEAPTKVVKKTVYAWDARGNTDSCQVNIEIRDNVGACRPATAMARVSGAVMSENYKGISATQVILSDALGPIATQMTGSSGQFIFEDVRANQDYSLQFNKQGYASEGITVSDLLLIQNHILGNRLLDSPYKIIAADTDNNGRISATDLVRLRRVILQLDEGFSNGQKSWRFVTMSQKFPDPLSPFPFTESIALRQLSGFTVGQDVMAIKIGDVNNSHAAYKNNNGQTRSIKRLRVEYDKQSSSYKFYPGDAQYLLGLELHLAFDPSVVKVNLINPGSLLIGDNDFAIDNNKGFVHMAWVGASAIELPSEEWLFEIVVNSGETERAFNISDLHATEWVNESMEVQDMDIQYLVRPENTATESVVLYPNPFVDHANIEFSAKLRGEYKLTVMTFNGQILQSRDYLLDKGRSTLNVELTSLDYQGLVLFELTSPTGEIHILRGLKIP